MHAVPEAKVCPSCCVVVTDRVVGIGDPESCRGDVIILQGCGGDYVDGQVVLEYGAWNTYIVVNDCVYIFYNFLSTFLGVNNYFVKYDIICSSCYSSSFY